MSARGPSKKTPTFSGEGFELLLASLDQDREQAGEKYELLRLRLMKFFVWNAVADPDELTDETLDVAARKLSEGEPIRNLCAYCLGVARNLLIEEARRQQKKREACKDPAMYPDAQQDPEHQRLLDIFERCIEELPAGERRLLLDYHSRQKRAKIKLRQALADELGIPLSALRSRVWRLRSALECAINRRMDNKAEE